MPENTCVYLVGAGPGDPKLLTVRAVELFKRADIVVYDYLANDTILAHVNAGAKRIYVGKQGFTKHLSQQEITDMLVDLAKTEGGCIVRLKGGDPFVFGRGGEEALALSHAQIPFEIVPGITAGIAAPAYAGIPVTHRGISSSVTLVTGHEQVGKTTSDLDWHYLAHVGTLCFYMGVHDIQKIADNLMREGMSSNTPVALIRWGTRPDQEVLRATLANVTQKVTETGFSAPAIIVVGNVVNLADDLSWYVVPPLAGKTVVVTRARAQASALTTQLEHLGARVIEAPSICISPCGANAQSDQAISNLVSGSYDWIVFTSANGVACFFDLLKKSGFDARAFAATKVCAIGPATARALQSRGIYADCVPETYVAESVVDALGALGVGAGSNILIPRAQKTRKTLPDGLAHLGAHVDILSVYETGIPDEASYSPDLVQALLHGDIDAITFTSSSCAHNFVDLIRRAGITDISDTLNRITTASIGPITSQTLRDMGIPVSVEASEFTIPGLVKALVKHFDTNEN